MSRWVSRHDDVTMIRDARLVCVGALPGIGRLLDRCSLTVSGTGHPLPCLCGVIGKSDTHAGFLIHPERDVKVFRKGAFSAWVDYGFDHLYAGSSIV